MHLHMHAPRHRHDWAQQYPRAPGNGCPLLLGVRTRLVAQHAPACQAGLSPCVLLLLRAVTCCAGRSRWAAGAQTGAGDTRLALLL